MQSYVTLPTPAPPLPLPVVSGFSQNFPYKYLKSTPACPPTLPLCYLIVAMTSASSDSHLHNQLAFFSTNSLFALSTMTLRMLQAIWPQHVRRSLLASNDWNAPPLYFWCFGHLGRCVLRVRQGLTAGFQVHPAFIHRMYNKKVTLEEITMGEMAIPPLLPGLTI
ncbi:hypothetical protein B0H10DRAFT_315455 [Mycena sp. CBHHK59/15]|nr:hypothetical protein B0H10DRAFT_315455 [Mycena sp. CBHHK59/15]